MNEIQIKVMFLGATAPFESVNKNQQNNCQVSTEENNYQQKPKILSNQ